MKKIKSKIESRGLERRTSEDETTSELFSTFTCGENENQMSDSLQILASGLNNIAEKEDRVEEKSANNELVELKSEKNFQTSITAIQPLVTFQPPLQKQKWFKQLKWVLLILGGVLFFSSIASIFTESFGITLRNIINGDENTIRLIIHAQIPRTLLVIVTGVGMSICGLIMQSLTNNKYVSPMTTGTLDGARLGVLLAMMIVPGATLLVQGAFSFAITMGTTVLFIILINRLKVKNKMFVPLVGIIYGGVIASITTIIAIQQDGALQTIMQRLVGNFTLTLSGWDIWIPIMIISGLVVISYVFSNWFMIAGLGEGTAKNLGLNYRWTVNLGLFIVSAITAMILPTAGIFPFLGLIVPNIVSLYMGDNIRRALPVTALFGAIFLLVCDILARVIIWPSEMPAGVVVGVLGAAIFLLLLFLQSDTLKSLKGAIKRRREKKLGEGVTNG
ncbi:MAG: iron chelate uptake ABC transporter family permease subunit [Firmicutes bacterium]|nr:iron chelate uptake ABC transporter family permease subunit [Bacillota bacterium]MCL2255690.1 iron chelate uptake ABC transporter family permease subunit [Bacillota bacterium]